MKVFPFDDLDLECLDEYYESEIEVPGSIVPIDLNFESSSVDVSVIESLKGLIARIDELAKDAFLSISEDFDLGDESETARFYLEHHLDELNKDEKLSIFGTENVGRDEFLSALKLYRIGFYPEDEEAFAVFDVQLPKDLTDYLMAVTFDVDGNLSYITMES